MQGQRMPAAMGRGGLPNRLPLPNQNQVSSSFLLYTSFGRFIRFEKKENF